MAYQKGSDMKEISSPGQAEKQLMENQSVLLWSVKKWLVKYWCGIHKEKKKKEELKNIMHTKKFWGYKEYCPEYLACINPQKPEMLTMMFERAQSEF